MSNPCIKTPFVHLHVHSAYSFLDGASSPEALVRCAAAEGMTALALTDHDNLCGAPEFALLCRKHGIKPIHGAELTLTGGRIVALAKNRRGFASLCRLLTRAHLDNDRGKPSLSEEHLLSEGEGLILLAGGEQSPPARALRARNESATRDFMRRMRARFGKDFYLEIQRTFEPSQERLNRALVALAREMNVPLVATNNVHYAHADQARVQDILCCIRHLIRVDDPHEERRINAEYSLKTAAAMRSLFADIPEAVENSARIAEQCEDYEIADRRFLPRFRLGEGEQAGRRLRQLTYCGACARYGAISAALQARIDYELAIIGDLGFADYFLVVEDLVKFARENRIRHAGRGSAADSVVAYCLDITKVDAFRRNLRFERFINPERAHNLPDIDIDFDARHRDRVTEYVTRTYGRDRTATVCTFSRFRARSAIRDVAKALGFSVADIDRIAKSMHWATGAGGIRRAIAKRPELRALDIPEARFRLLFDLCEALDQVPRHISTHLGGVVITGDPVWEIAPVQMAAKGVPVIQYDKDGVEDLKLLKLDLLCLRMLGAVEDSVTMISASNNAFDLDRIPEDDPATFQRIRTADTAGAFQIESPAQMSLHPRLKTSTYEDVVASVALIRPGPVQGEMVEPFIRRRNRAEAVAEVHPVIDRILGHTYGVVLYQEQVVSIAVELAGFTPGQADSLRRAISHHRSIERMKEIGEQFVAQAIANGVDRALAETVFSWLEGYAGYGFCEAHAAAFGDTSYRTAYLLQHHPAEFYAAVLNNEPMGFYPAHTIVNEARCRRIIVHGPDVNRSVGEFTVENGAILVGLKQVKGISQAEIAAICEARPFRSWADFARRARVARDVHENLILCGAFDDLHANRRALLFALGTLAVDRSREPRLELDTLAVPENVQDFTPDERLCHEWEILGFSPARHPLEFWRKRLAKADVLPNVIVRKIADTNRPLRAAGWVIRPHTPPTKSGKTVVFFSLEDETGLLNVTVFPSVYEKFGHLIYTCPLLIVEGRKDRRGANSLIADLIWSADELASGPAEAQC